MQDGREAQPETALRQRDAFLPLVEAFPSRSELARELASLVDVRVQLRIGKVGLSTQPAGDIVEDAVHRNRDHAHVAERASAQLYCDEAAHSRDHLAPYQVEVAFARRPGNDVERQLDCLGIDGLDPLDEVAELSLALRVAGRAFGQLDRLDSEVPGFTAPIGHGLQEGGGHRFRPDAVDRRNHEDAERDLPNPRRRELEDPPPGA